MEMVLSSLIEEISSKLNVLSSSSIEEEKVIEALLSVKQILNFLVTDKKEQEAPKVNGLTSQHLIDIAYMLPLYDLLSLALCNKHFFDSLTKCVFRASENIDFKYYNPVGMSVSKGINHRYLSKVPFPPNLTYLKVKAEGLLIDSLPSSLLHLQLHAHFTSQLDYLLPPRLLSLSISGARGHEFNQSISCLPSSLLSLSIHDVYFNQPIDKLPSSLTFLSISSLSRQFNQSLDHLPPSLKHLEIGLYFNKPITSFPPFLETLNITSSIFKSHIQNLPSSLKKLSIETSSYPHSLTLPDSLTQLSLRRYTLPLSFPPSLKILHLPHCDSFDNFPNSIEELVIGKYASIHFPSNLTSLKIKEFTKMNEVEFKLPSSLKKLELFEASSKLLSLPPILTHLTFNNEFYNFIPPPLPDSLTHLYLPASYDLPLPPLPSSLLHIRVGNYYTHPIPSLPQIQNVQFGEATNAKELPCSLSVAIKHLGDEVNDISYFPPSLESLTLAHEVTDEKMDCTVLLPPSFPFKYLYLQKTALYGRMIAHFSKCKSGISKELRDQIAILE